MNGTEYGVHVGLYTNTLDTGKNRRTRRYSMHYTITFVRKRSKFEEDWGGERIVKKDGHLLQICSQIEDRFSGNFYKKTIADVIGRAIGHMGYDSNDIEYVFCIRSEYGNVRLTDEEYYELEKDTEDITYLGKLCDYESLVDDWLNGELNTTRLCDVLTGNNSIIDEFLNKKDDTYAKHLVLNDKGLYILFFKNEPTETVIRRYINGIYTYIVLDDNGKEWLKKRILNEENIDDTILNQKVVRTIVNEKLIDELNQKIYKVDKIEYNYRYNRYWNGEEILDISQEMIYRIIGGKDLINDELIESMAKKYVKYRLMGLNFVERLKVILDKNGHIIDIQPHYIAEDKLKSEPGFPFENIEYSYENDGKNM